MNYRSVYYASNPNKTEEENKKNSQRIGALMLKVAKSLDRDRAQEKSSAVVLGEELPPPEKKTLEEGACPECGKKHVDIGKPEHWVTQKPKECWAACIKILTNYGLPQYSGYPDKRIIIANQVGDKMIKAHYTKGISYINEQLEKGNPILVGVDRSLAANTYNSHKATDHFVVIVGRKCNGSSVIYLFYEVGTKYEEKGVSMDNFLEIKNGLLIGSPIYNKKHKYTVTEVRKNL
ncbi:hypothetical protein GO009_10890 [Muricauda sp. TY007]|uniref:hypothetical protein n=1 Tax=Allomuricauda sp. TY007 TaxID=2683200 RepID=UPI0013C01FCA|nr:hypothetical protein [Muricauda sp. TY007]NDV16532.1 hypothetical protein [Muricauda sp. TY007]